MGLQPEGENIRKAVKWVAEMCKDNPDKSLKTIMHEAALRFNLSPLDTEYLMRGVEKLNCGNGETL